MYAVPVVKPSLNILRMQGILATIFASPELDQNCLETGSSYQSNGDTVHEEEIAAIGDRGNLHHLLKLTTYHRVWCM